MKKERAIYIVAALLVACLNFAIFAILFSNSNKTNRVAIVINGAAQTMSAFSSTLIAPEPTAITPTDSLMYYVNNYGGDINLYIKILSMDDCATLQEQFDTFHYDNQHAAAGSDVFQWTQGYMAAADNRMKALGCY